MYDGVPPGHGKPSQSLVHGKEDFQGGGWSKCIYTPAIQPALIGVDGAEGEVLRSCNTEDHQKSLRGINLKGYRAKKKLKSHKINSGSTH